MLLNDPPCWLPGGHAQTIVPALWARRRWPVRADWQRQRWRTPDGDFIDVDLMGRPTDFVGKPLLVLFHGLEGSSRSHYAKAFAQACEAKGWACAVPHFRGCSGQINSRPRAYHSGDHEEIDWILRTFRAKYPGSPLVAVGVSLGGNALARWAGEHGAAAGLVVRALASICSPLDLVASGEAMGRGINRHVYTRMFLSSMVPKALLKLDQYPKLFSRESLLAAKDLYAFDNVFTAPLHGFTDTLDYWSRASAKPLLRAIAVPALLVNALNDPFVPAWSLPRKADVSSAVELWQPVQGGHVGFPGLAARGVSPAKWLMAMPESVVDWLAHSLP